jgi:hypothetical protein
MQCKLTWRLYPAATLCLGLCSSLLAQDSRITGHITDASGAVVAAAVVTATQVDSGSTRQVLCNAQGYFQLAPLPPGEYRIEAAKPGFKPLLRTGVELSPGLTATVRLQMDNARVAETWVLAARKAGTGSLITYMCDFSLGSGCEMLETGNSGSAAGVTTANALLF